MFRNLLRRPRWSVVPVYDYVLATEPLTEDQLAALRWDPSIGVSDSGNQFHYYRVTPDRRILWGGYDAIYHFGRSISDAHADRRETFETLARHFARDLPAAAGHPLHAPLGGRHRHLDPVLRPLRHRARRPDGVRDRLHRPRRRGLAVRRRRDARPARRRRRPSAPASRWCARRPLPFPPEPFAWLGIQATRWSLAREDATGRRNPWLRLLDRLGLGFDS